MRKIHVKVKKGINHVTKQDDGSYVVATNVPREKGKANQAVIELLARHLQVRPNQLAIISGHTSSQKIIAIDWVSCYSNEPS